MVKVKISLIAFVSGTIIWALSVLFMTMLSRYELKTEALVFYSTLSLVLGVATAWFVYTEVKDEKTITLEKGDCLVENDKLTDVAEEVTLWKSDPYLKGKRIIEGKAFRFFEVHMRLSPITDNPKVRNLIYWATVSVDDRQKFYDFFLKDSECIKPENLIRKSCYEFNEKFSTELAKLYNPLDEIQQERFSEMLLGFLLPIIEKVDTGLKIVRVEFSL
ncbi:MAG: hypothetical protein WC608_03325 [Parcubacteria group bacterium]